MCHSIQNLIIQFTNMAKNVDIKKYSKKELKDYINDNGFFYGMEINAIGEVPDKYRSKIPEGAIYFEGIASDGEFSRNGYKIKKEAWKPAIKGYMTNPIILLQHETEESIGNAVWAEVTDRGLEIGGYLFDDYTESRFSRGLLKGISTGHLTNEVEFENSKTGQILNEEEFMRLKWEEQIKDEWILVVNKLEWFETSIVTLPSNRKALITSKNAIMDYLDKHKTIANGLNAPSGASDSDEAQTIDQTISEVPETAEIPTENSGETPEVTANTSENDEIVSDEATQSIPSTENLEQPETVATFDSTQVDAGEILAKIEADPALNYFMQKIVDKMETQQAKIATLQNQLKSVPQRKAIARIASADNNIGGYQPGDLAKNLLAKHKIYK